MNVFDAKGFDRYFFAFLLIVILFSAIRIPFLNKEYAPEEVLWVRGGEGVAATGFAWAYLGEQNQEKWVSTKGPMLPWLLGIAFKFFGEREAVSRLIPFLFALGQIFLLYFLARRIFGGDLGKTIGLLAASVTAINPFAVQNAVQLDLDGGIVGFFVLLILFFSWPFFSGERARSGMNKTALVLASLFGFLVRFDTPLMVFFGVVLCALIFKKNKEAVHLGKLFSFSMVAAVSFLAGWNAIVGQFRQTLVPFYSTYAALAGAKPQAVSRVFDAFPHLQLGAFTPLAAMLFPKAAFITSVFLWITVPMAIFLMFIIARLIAERRFKDQNFMFLLVPAAVIFLAFAAVSPSFNYPRYIQPAFLLAVLAASAYFVLLAERCLPAAGKKFTIGFSMVLCGSFLFALRAPWSAPLFEDRIRTNPLAAGLGLLASVAAALVFLIVVRKEKYIAAICACLAAIYVGFSAVIIAHDLKKPYSLSAYYGNYGFKEAGALLKKIAGPRDVVAAVDTIGYYFGGPYYDVTAYADEGIPGVAPTIIAVYRVPAQRFEKIIAGKKFLASFGTVEIYSDTKSE